MAYVTNRTCLANCSPTPEWFSEFCDDVVVATSTDNGSSWTLSTVFRGTGEPVTSWTFQAAGGATLGRGSFVYFDSDPGFWSVGYSGFGLAALFQYAPPTAIVWNTSGPDLFVAWGGSSNQSEHDWLSSGAFAYQALYTATSRNDGATWSSQQLGYTGGSTQGVINEPGGHEPQESEAYPLNYYNVGLTVSRGVVYLSYQTSNQSAPLKSGDTNLCGLPIFTGYDQATVEWLTNSTDGIHWSSPLPIVIDGTPYMADSITTPYLAYNSAVLIQNNTPIIASSMPSTCLWLDFYGIRSCTLSFQDEQTVTSNLDVATVSHPPTLSLTVKEVGLPSGTNWSAAISGNQFEQSTASFFADVPDGLPFLLDPANPIYADGQEFLTYTGGGQYNFSANGSVTVRYTTVQSFNFDLTGYDPVINIMIMNQTWGFGYSSEYQLTFASPAVGWTLATYGCSMPWYLPSGFVLNVTNSDEVDSNLNYQSLATPTYWAGSGAGNYTGPSTSYSVV
ncbi:MAG: hypothetical protein L3K03_01535, partial [Thermoplasmata archaeon]|nr:hypothetical protein [Thermoplasmata archaeon]